MRERINIDIRTGMILSRQIFVIIGWETIIILADGI